MRLSKRGEYGIRAMIFLTGSMLGNHVAMVQIKDIAEQERIPVKYLEQILLSLKNSGLLNSKMGVGGGYYLARPAEEITFGQIVRILDGPLAPIRCVSQMAYEPCDCPDENICGLRMVMGDVRNAIAGILDHTSLADVYRRQEAVRQAVERK
jgi:Rrf2 family protein